MSNLGLNATIYSATKKYTDLLDEYLVEKRSKVRSPSNDMEKGVKEFFSQLKDKDVLEPEIQIIASILERACREKGISLFMLINKITDGLECRSKDDSFVKDLETVAIMLSNESSSALSRMRGSAR